MFYWSRTSWSRGRHRKCSAGRTFTSGDTCTTGNHIKTQCYLHWRGPSCALAVTTCPLPGNPRLTPSTIDDFCPFSYFYNGIIRILFGLASFAHHQLCDTSTLCVAVVSSFPLLCEYSSLYLPVLLLKGVWVVSRFWLLRNSTFWGMSFGDPTHAFFPRNTPTSRIYWL